MFQPLQARLFGYIVVMQHLSQIIIISEGRFFEGGVYESRTNCIFSKLHEFHSFCQVVHALPRTSLEVSFQCPRIFSPPSRPFDDLATQSHEGLSLVKQAQLDNRASF